MQIADWREADKTSESDPQSKNPHSEIDGPVAQRNESATLRRSRSHVQIVPGPPNQILRSGRTGKARVSEARLCRFESYLRSQFEKFDAEYTGVVKPPGTDS